MCSLKTTQALLEYYSGATGSTGALYGFNPRDGYQSTHSFSFSKNSLSGPHYILPLLSTYHIANAEEEQTNNIAHRQITLALFRKDKIFIKLLNIVSLIVRFRLLFYILMLNVIYA